MRVRGGSQRLFECRKPLRSDVLAAKGPGFFFRRGGPKKKGSDLSCARSRMQGHCSVCAEWADGSVHEYEFVCNSCWALYTRRCYTFAMVYDYSTMTCMSTGHSRQDHDSCCAERNALFKVVDDARPKVLTVFRVYKKANDLRYHNSQPCSQCLSAMLLHNVKVVGYSVPGRALSFTWKNTDDIQPTVSSQCNVLVRFD